LKYGLNRAMRFRAQIRFWGYGLENPNHESEMTQIQVDAPNEVKDAAGSEQDLSPVASEREWQEQAQDNVLDRLQQAGLLAPPGEVGKVMETVVNNLIVTNHLENLPTVHCRVLLTSTLESLAIGDTIIMSRGLIDVLPDEPSLAAMLAHELAHIVLQQTVNIDSTQWAFEDRLMMPDEDLLKYLKFQPSERDEEAADAEAIELLKNSPYKNQLGQAGLFLRAMANVAPHAPHLFGAHLGSRLAKGDRVLRLAALMNGAPKLETRNVDQIAALPLGARVKVDSWSDAVELMKTKPVALLSAREKMPFEIAPLFPYLTRLPSVQARR
ncbi:MAG TPA: M48 family metalloprotease, partial [Terriglobia bacterium]|nr:M48 family metalloprotease [Terriglobia bacterium]